VRVRANLPQLSVRRQNETRGRRAILKRRWLHVEVQAAPWDKRVTRQYVAQSLEGVLFPEPRWSRTAWRKQRNASNLLRTPFGSGVEVASPVVPGGSRFRRRSRPRREPSQHTQESRSKHSSPPDRPSRGLLTPFKSSPRHAFLAVRARHALRWATRRRLRLHGRFGLRLHGRFRFRVLGRFGRGLGGR
jgi:hypothetical protein